MIYFHTIFPSLSRNQSCNLFTFATAMSTCVCKYVLYVCQYLRKENCTTIAIFVFTAAVRACIAKGNFSFFRYGNERKHHHLGQTLRSLYNFANGHDPHRTRTGIPYNLLLDFAKWDLNAVLHTYAC